MSSYESFSLVSAESQCCGTPVLFFDVGGIKETIVDSSSLSVEYDDFEAIKNILDTNAFDNVNRNNISSLSMSKFAKESVYNSYIALYKKLWH